MEQAAVFRVPSPHQPPRMYIYVPVRLAVSQPRSLAAALPSGRHHHHRHHHRHCLRLLPPFSHPPPHLLALLLPRAHVG